MYQRTYSLAIDLLILRIKQFHLHHMRSLADFITPLGNRSHVPAEMRSAREGFAFDILLCGGFRGVHRGLKSFNLGFEK